MMSRRTFHRTIGHANLGPCLGESSLDHADDVPGFHVMRALLEMLANPGEVLLGLRDPAQTLDVCQD